MTRIHLVIIDPQQDFCHARGSLYVPGAEHDMDRLATMVARLGDRLSSIHISLDSHQRVDISHPLWWRGRQGERPDPFTTITAADVREGQWSTTEPSYRGRTLAYLEALEQGGRYPHVVWPEHCLIGDEGHNIAPVLRDAVHEWEGRFARARLMMKGTNPFTEHFSCVRAEVPDPQDPTTQLNSGLLTELESADVIVLAGEALSHCLMSSIEDIADGFSDPAHVRKMVLLRDASSAIPDPPGTTLFSDKVSAFLARMGDRGMTIARTTDFLA